VPQQKRGTPHWNNFRDGTLRVLVATDVAGGGFNVDGITM